PSVYHVPFPYCFRCPHRTGPDCCDEPFVSLDRLFRHVVAPDEVAAMIVEPILGEGGYVVPPDEFLPRLRALCDRHNILLIFDEIQTGFGRTGAMFAAQTFGVTPDVLVLSKSIASGFPLSAVAAAPGLMRRWAAEAHGTTFGGNPVACAAAVATMEVFREERVLDNVRERSQEAFGRLRALAERSPIIGDLRGRGLMIGLEFVDPRTGAPDGAVVQRILERCLERGLLLYAAGYAGHVLRFIPPLNVTAAELAAGLDILEGVVTT
ncbi:MAG: aminotransferase class III-fold pyridoxal phosphate-dependent enzyme, partial [Armatimonadota bacterium]|nr:aminotransferase class III-fold pyridoxal phosphate-dependent enzyme [Armatimonadota bacterium]